MLLVAQIDPRAAGYAPAELPALYRRIIERVAAVPGVTRASMSANGLVRRIGDRAAASRSKGYIRGRDEQVTGQQGMGHRRVLPHGGPGDPGMAAGSGHKTPPSRKLSVINETMARQYFKNRNPIGRRWSYGSTFGPDGFEIIGVVRRRALQRR